MLVHLVSKFLLNSLGLSCSRKKNNIFCSIQKVRATLLNKQHTHWGQGNFTVCLFFLMPYGCYIHVIYSTGNRRFKVHMFTNNVACPHYSIKQYILIFHLLFSLLFFFSLSKIQKTLKITQGFHRAQGISRNTLLEAPHGFKPVLIW